MVHLESYGGLLRFESWSDVARLVEHAAAAGRLPPTATWTAGPPVSATGYEVSYGSASASPPGYIGTNVQVPGVDEADIVKTDGRYIYVASGGRILVYRAYPPGSLARVAVVDVCGYIESHTPALRVALVAPNGSIVEVLGEVGVSGCGVQGLYALPDGRLAAIATAWANYRVAQAPRTWVLVASANGSVEWAYWVTGAYYDSRLVESTGTLALVAYMRALQGYGVARPATSEGPLNASQVYLAGLGASVYTLVASIDPGAHRASAIALLGPGPTAVYMDSHGGLYLALGSRPAYVALTAPGTLGVTIVVSGSGVPVASLGSTRIVKLRVGPGTLEPAGAAGVPGRVWSQWYMNYANGYLYVVTESRGGNVSLYVVNTSSMEVAASLVGVAVHERVGGVRLLGGILYLVTYRSYDPLFAINVSDPLHPRVIGYLKAPGFDAYLHPVGEGLLLGLGRAPNGSLRVTLYRLEANGTPVVEVRLYLGAAWTPVLSGPHGSRAFVYDPARGLAVIPYASLRGPDCGAYLVRVSNGTLVLAGRLVHAELKPGPWEVRALIIGGYLYTVMPSHPSGFPTVRAWSLATLEPVASAP